MERNLGIGLMGREKEKSFDGGEKKEERGEKMKNPTRGLMSLWKRRGVYIYKMEARILGVGDSRVS